MKEISKEEFEFYSTQFLMHVEKVNKIHEERSNLMRYSVVATFGYFGWLFTHPEVAQPYADVLLISLSIWMVPFGFNLFGWWRNWFFLETIQKHGGFLDYLVSKGMGCPNHFRDYMGQKGFVNRKVHPSQFFWWAILFVSVATGIFGVATDQILLDGS